VKRAYRTTWRLLICLLPLGGALVLAYNNYANHANSAREAVVNADREVVREAIREYTEEKGKPPQTLEDLVDAGYLRAVPRFSDVPLRHRESN
jgi:general secretion pathway protein G